MTSADDQVTEEVLPDLSDLTQVRRHIFTSDWPNKPLCRALVDEIESLRGQLRRWQEAARLTDEYTMHYVKPYPTPPFEGYICWLPGWCLYDVAHPPQRKPNLDKIAESITTPNPDTQREADKGRWDADALREMGLDK